MARKITLTFLDEHTAKTIGWPLRYAARQLGIWEDPARAIPSLRPLVRL